MIEHRAFVRFAALFEASLALLALLLAWIFEVRIDLTIPTPRAVLVGIIATIPMIGLYFIATKVPITAFQRIHDLLLSTLGRPLAQCRWHELALLAAFAGICEELLFRGVIQPWFSRLDETAGWVGTNLLFGLVHAVTPTYFILAAGIGAYLSGVLAMGGDLFSPMLAHTLYDWFAFLQIARTYRRLHGEDFDSQEEELRF